MSSALPPDLDGLDYVQPLGSGGYADVFLYEQQMPRMKVAVKVLKSEGLTPSIKQQFIDEANTMAQLADHPYIVQVFRAGTSGDGRPFLVMKYYPPPNLAQRARSSRFSVEEVLRTGIQLSSAVETAHRAGVIHRDIKPANVLVSQYGSPGLTDFGIAGRGGALEDLDDDLGVSVPWAPPEVLFGQSNGDARADVYALAATLWQLLVGRSPFEVPGGDNSATALMRRIRSNPPPSTGRADVPQSLERLLAQAMSKNPLARPATSLEFARSLQQIEQDQRFSRTAIVVLDEVGHSGEPVRRPISSSDSGPLRSGGGTAYSTPPPPLGQPVIGGGLSGGRSIPPVAPTRIAGVSQSAPGRGRAGGTHGHSGPAPAHPSGPRPGAEASRPEATNDGGRKGVQVGLLPLVASIVGVLLVVGIIVGVVLLSGRSEGGGGGGGETTAGGGGGGLDGVPSLELSVDGSRMTVTAEYQGFREDDIFQVETGQDTDAIQKGTPMSWPAGTKTKDYSVTPGKQQCVRVRVVRGSTQTAWSEIKCELGG